MNDFGFVDAKVEMPAGNVSRWWVEEGFWSLEEILG